jgi:hypothetical protein
MNGIFDEPGATASTVVSVSSTGSEPTVSTFAFAQAVSDDGLKVVFRGVSDLATPPIAFGWHVWVRDLAAGTTTLLDKSAAGTPGNAGPVTVAISADGTTAVFDSPASNLVSGDTNGVADIFKVVLATGAISRVSVSSAGVQADGPSFAPRVSADGSRIVFHSLATNLGAVPDTNTFKDVYVRDTAAGTTRRISVSALGLVPDGESVDAAISGNGDVVAFASTASNLVSAPTFGVKNIFAHHLPTGTIVLASADPSGSGGDAPSGGSGQITLAHDGSVVAFDTTAPDLLGTPFGPSQVVTAALPFSPTAAPRLILTEVHTGPADFIEIASVGNAPASLVGVTVSYLNNSECPPFAPVTWSLLGSAITTTPGFLLPGESTILQDCGLPANPPLLAPAGECAPFNISWAGLSHGEVALKDAGGAELDYVQWHTVGAPEPFNGFRANPAAVSWKTAPLFRAPGSDSVRRPGCAPGFYANYATGTGSGFWVADAMPPTPAAPNPAGDVPAPPLPGLDLGVTSPAPGSLSITVDTSLPPFFGLGELFVLVSFMPTLCAGSGPIAGLPLDVAPELGLPLGSEPFHVLMDLATGYAYSASGVSGGLSFEARAGLFYFDFIAGTIGVVLSNYVYHTTP